MIVQILYYSISSPSEVSNQRFSGDENVGLIIERPDLWALEYANKMETKVMKAFLVMSKLMTDLAPSHARANYAFLELILTTKTRIERQSKWRSTKRDSVVVGSVIGSHELIKY